MHGEYFVTKTWAPGKGYSCMFRNWRAKSHCNLGHGYDLIFATTFACGPNDLTEEGWVVDFGGLDPISDAIKAHFDHKWVVAEDDPCADMIRDFNERCMVLNNGRRMFDLVFMPSVGCEAFSAWLARISADHLWNIGRLGPVNVRHSVVYEHQANQAGFRP